MPTRIRRPASRAFNFRTPLQESPAMTTSDRFLAARAAFQSDPTPGNALEFLNAAQALVVESPIAGEPGILDADALIASLGKSDVGPLKTTVAPKQADAAAFKAGYAAALEGEVAAQKAAAEAVLGAIVAAAKIALAG